MSFSPGDQGSRRVAARTGDEEKAGVEGRSRQDAAHKPNIGQSAIGSRKRCYAFTLAARRCAGWKASAAGTCLAMRTAIATGRTERDPTADLRGALAPIVVTNRAALTDPKEVGGLLHAIDGYVGQPATKYALKLAAYVFIRPIELRAAEWTDEGAAHCSAGQAYLAVKASHLPST